MVPRSPQSLPRSGTVFASDGSLHDSMSLENLHSGSDPDSGDDLDSVSDRSSPTPSMGDDEEFD